MPRRPSLPKDPSQRAKALLDMATDATGEKIQKTLTEAQQFAQKGGLKGGAARAQSLSSKRKSEIAKMAAEARWKSNKYGRK